MAFAGLVAVDQINVQGEAPALAINVDVGEVVVGADFLNLAQRVPECMPVPESDVLKRGLIVLRVGRVDGRLRGKLALHDSVQSVGLPRQVDVVGDIGLLAHELVRFDDKAADVPGDYLKADITDRSRKDRHAGAGLSRRSFRLRSVMSAFK